MITFLKKRNKGILISTMTTMTTLMSTTTTTTTLTMMTKTTMMTTIFMMWGTLNDYQRYYKLYCDSSQLLFTFFVTSY